jgi:SAM-dependent methyltransferase
VAHSLSFAVAAEAYDRHVGRYGAGLAEGLIAAAHVRRGQRALDVGSGPGVLARPLVEVLGAENVAAVDPSEPFVAALRERLPGVEAHVATAERLPFEDGSFDAALAQLVVNFMTDPELGVSEMRRVVKSGGVVAACVWDYAGEMTLLRSFWDAAAALDTEGATARDERTTMRFARSGELAELWRDAGMNDIQDGELVVGADYESFADLWEPFAAGVGPAGAYAATLDQGRQRELRDEYRSRLGAPQGPFRLTARAWYVTGRK